MADVRPLHAPKPVGATGVIVFADGRVVWGQGFGAEGEAVGELCFNTAMTGYQEVFTDPSYYGQIVIMNNVHIGNYGVKDEDIESDSVKIKGLIARNLEELYSRKMAQGSLEEYLIKNNVVCIEDVDTRALVAHIRQKGAMNCIISSEILDLDHLGHGRTHRRTSVEVTLRPAQQVACHAGVLDPSGHVQPCLAQKMGRDQSGDGGTVPAAGPAHRVVIPPSAFTVFKEDAGPVNYYSVTEDAGTPMLHQLRLEEAPC